MPVSPKASPRAGRRTRQHPSPRTPRRVSSGSVESSFTDDEESSGSETAHSPTSHRSSPANESARSFSTSPVTAYSRTPTSSSPTSQGSPASSTKPHPSPGEKLYPSLDGLMYERSARGGPGYRRTKLRGSPASPEDKDTSREGGDYKPYLGDSNIKSRRARPSDVYQQADQQEAVWSTFGRGVVVILAVIVMVFVLRGSKRPEEGEENDAQIVLSQFVSGFDELKATFPSQTPRFWSTLASQVKRIIREDRPIQPAVLLLASTEGSHQVADCVAAKMADLMQHANKSSRTAVYINAGQLRGDPDDAKLSLDEQLGAGLGGGAQVAVIGGLEHMHPVPAMLLHAYCDNENAPYKKVVIIFTVHTDGSPGSGGDHLVEEVLTKKWESTLQRDNFAALMSRIANNVALAQGEDGQTMKQHCS